MPETVPSDEGGGMLAGPVRQGKSPRRARTVAQGMRPASRSSMRGGRKMIRQPVLAGTWYPGDPGNLAHEVESL
ncbi:MAG: hypothetical protein D6795_17060, partial [Deltaproteobacteria bacterium]